VSANPETKRNIHLKIDPMADNPLPLPIDPHLPEIIAILQTAGALVLTAPPGAGKTTRVPRALHDAGYADRGQILILEPRRLAARMAAFRVAQEFGEKPGGTVGYSIRFENVAGPQTRIRFLTEAILARQIIRNPSLAGVSAVILDEFHERHLATDLALSFLNRIQSKNPALKIIVMSATLDAEPVVSFLANSRFLSIGGAPFDLSIEYEDRVSDRPLHDKVASATARLLRSQLRGDILVFLPGAAEIRRCAEALQTAEERFGIRLHRLHGDLPASEQRRAIEPSAHGKIILATNVAETSITIPGIAAVIDSGLARIAGHSAWSGFPTLTTAKISKASARQRAGRAGRTQAGRVLRLYTRPDFESRPEHETPEIRRADLAEAVLMLHGAGIQDLGSFTWFEPPSPPAIAAAENLLVKLGAIDAAGRVSDTGARMLQMPVHPRLARLILEGERLKVADESALLAALLSERDIRMDSRSSLGGIHSKSRSLESGSSDLTELIERFREAEQARFSQDRILDLELDPGAVQSVRRSHSQLRRIISTAQSAGRRRPPSDPIEEALRIAALTAFPDRVARRRKTGSHELLLAGGGSAILSPASVVQAPLFLVAVDAEERISRNAVGTTVRIASAIEIEWLAAMFPHSILQKTELIWNGRAGRVDEVQRACYEHITLEERVQPAPPSEEASRMLASAVLGANLSPFRDHASLSAFQARLTFLSGYFPSETWPDMGDSAMCNTVVQLCSGKNSMEELAPISIVEALASQLTARQRMLLEREAPERIKLKSGRFVKIHYEPARPPWIESRLQDFFGMKTLPRICSGQASLTAHLLAPNGRAVQVTQDLEGFWMRHYPAIRRELQRRYPKHAWPEL
jgi:ATP-dependent helicase HrpB